MSSHLMICSKLDSLLNKKLNKLDINISDTDVSQLSQSVSKNFNLNEENFDLMCFGRILTPDKRLDSYGIKNGNTIYLLRKIHFECNDNFKISDNSQKSKPAQDEIQQMVIALRTALMNASFRSMLDKLGEFEFRENLMAVTPGLREDPSVFAILQDPDLLTTLTEPLNVHKVLERHPCLLEAATFLAATFHEDNNSTNTGPSGHSLLGRDYSLDNMSDDEDMSEGDGAEQQNITRAAAQHFADMMVRAFQTNQNQSNQARPQGIITTDMLTQALQSSSSSTTTTPTVAQPEAQPQPSTSSTAQRLRGWATQLQQMRDLGINDEIVAIQALEATNGDIQAAINIIFSDNN